jgi:sulfur relay (sulfurtransferase) DsrF/TusC family protein
MAHKIKLSIIITHFPYDLEYAFGAISFAIASMNHQIETNVIFAEDGVYALINDHHVDEEDKIFNIQEIVESTQNEEFLKYYILKESLDKRELTINQKFKDIPQIISNNLFRIINLPENYYLHRVLFF